MVVALRGMANLACVAQDVLIFRQIFPVVSRDDLSESSKSIESIESAQSSSESIE